MVCRKWFNGVLGDIMRIHRFTGLYPKLIELLEQDDTTQQYTKEMIMKTVKDYELAVEFRELEFDVIRWADDRGLLNKENAKTQALKTVSEVGEFCDNMAKGRDIRDDVGDILVTLIIQCEIQGTSLAECLGIAYTEISKRKGNTVNGIFIKDV